MPPHLLTTFKISRYCRQSSKFLDKLISFHRVIAFWGWEEGNHFLRRRAIAYNRGQTFRKQP
ncbi:MAG UNVERIFIED_CONTAM: hypothetical protein LVR29_15465 [Microcystis novacekii LVE1205-3]